MNQTDIAIIGLSCRFPGANDHLQYWQNIKEGREGITFFTNEELLEQGIAESLVHHPNYVKAGGIIDDADCFDAGYFGFTNREAEILSPQHRLALECTQEALEIAGYRLNKYDGKIGVYIGAGLNMYLLNNLMQQQNEIASNVGLYKAMIYNLNDTVPSLVAYKLNLKGPAISINTACSTSLVSVHYAAQALLTYECDIAVAGGVSLQIPVRTGYMYQEGSIFSPDGHCRTFDSKAAGTVPGSGAGVVVLKRLKEAIEDGDNIYAVIEGSAVNNDGFHKIGFTAPSLQGQTEVILDAQGVAAVHPDSIGYVEAHGTGTSMGDPIEISALTNAFRLNTNQKNYCAIGSVKANIGHLDAAAGVAGLIKTVMALKYRQIPPALHFSEHNPVIDFENSPFYVNTELKQWDATLLPRRAAVSAFGIGGTNAHLLLREASISDSVASPRAHQLITLSAKTNTALEKMCCNLLEYAQQHYEVNLADVAFTLQTGRENYEHKEFIVCQNKDELLGELYKKSTVTGVAEKKQYGAVLFYFGESTLPGTHLLKYLYKAEAVFKEHFDRCAKHIESVAAINIRDFLLADIPIGKLQGHPGESLPGMLFIFSSLLSLSQLWLCWGVKAKACLVNDEIGLKVAACIAGLCTMESAVASMLVEKNVPIEQNKASVKSSAPGNVGMPILSWKNGTIFTNRDLFGVHIFSENPGKRPVFDFISYEDVLLEIMPTGMPQLRNYQGDVLSQGYLTGNDAPVAVYSMLGELWRGGIEMDWAAYYRNEQRIKIPLPTHPQQKIRYWIQPAIKNTVQENNNIEHAPKKRLIEEWLYRPVWKEEDLPNNSFGIQSKQVLVFSNGTEFDNKLIAKFEAQGNNILTVLQGTSFKKDAQYFTINHVLPEHYELLFNSLEESACMPDVIIHLWNITGQKENLPVTPAEDTLEIAFFSILFTAQAIGKQGGKKKMNITIYSNNAQCITGNEMLEPVKATLTGPCALISKEYDYINCRSVDIDLSEMGVHEEQELINQLYLSANESIKAVFAAYRNDKRYIQDFEMYENDSLNDHRVLIREKSVCLITGGTGGMGLTFAMHLAERYKLKLVLVSRTGLPPRDLWNTLKNELDENDAIAEKIKKIEAIEQLGSEVLLLKADVANEMEMTDVIATAKNKFGTINSVIHAAGMPAGGMMQLRKAAQVKQTFAAKIDGTILLDKLLDTQSLDFFVLCSSLTAITRDMGQVDYISANAFQDAFANSKSASTKIISINWDAWKEVGMASEAVKDIKDNQKGNNIKKQLLYEQMKNGIAPKEGVAVFDRILNMGQPQVIVSTVDLKPRIKSTRLELNKIIKQAASQKLPASAQQERTVKTAYKPPTNDIELQLVQLWCQSFGISQIGIEDDFFELGGDSLLAVTIVENVNTLFNVELPSSSFMSATTIAKLAKLITGESESTTARNGYDKIMVEVKKGRPGVAPLFLVHPAGGEAYFYKDIAASLNEEQPVYAFRSQGLDEDETPVESVEAMASIYLKKLLAIHPNGPYLLGGASFGGVVAYEMAQRLTGAGKKISLLTLIDTPGPHETPDELMNDANAIYYFTTSMFDQPLFTIEEIQELYANKGLEYIFEKFKNLLPERNAEIDGEKISSRQLARLLSVFKTNILAMRKYQPKPYAGKIIYFKAKERRERYDPLHPELTWLNLPEEGIEVYVVPGNHITMNKYPNVLSMAKKLMPFLHHHKITEENI
jgi:acyl transferase domain-containing protein/thioesterase domain-containing protein/acyl carrier protein